MTKKSSQLTHIDAAQRPAMVDVGDKTITHRTATARSHVQFPPDVAAQLRDAALHVAKGSIIDTAIIAGTMAVKRTHDLIPFCHPLPIHGIAFAIDWSDETSLAIDCTVRTEHRTGVEMEALTGASIAALTVYDMCKALSHAIVIRDTRLVAKRGGKRDVGAESVA